MYKTTQLEEVPIVNSHLKIWTSVTLIMAVSDVSATVTNTTWHHCAKWWPGRSHKNYFVWCISSYLVITLIDKKIIADIFGNEELRLSFFLPKLSTLQWYVQLHPTMVLILNIVSLTRPYEAVETWESLSISHCKTYTRLYLTEDSFNIKFH